MTLALEFVLWAAVTFFCALGWATWMVRLADVCLCRKGAIHPDCPRHGWNR